MLTSTLTIFTSSSQERVSTVEKQKSEMMMQQALMQQQGGPSHLSHYAPGASQASLS